MTTPELIRSTLTVILRAYELPPEDYLVRDTEVMFTGERLSKPESFLDAFVQIAKRNELVILRDELSEQEFLEQFNSAYYPALFICEVNNVLTPVVLAHDKKGNPVMNIIHTDSIEQKPFSSFADFPGKLHTIMRDGIACAVICTCYPNKPLFSEYDEDGQSQEQPARWELIRRFGRLLRYERREIWYVIIYAVIIGLIGLTLPLGVQSIIGFVSSGRIATSVVVLIIVIIAALLIGGGLQIMQLYLVEHIQRRIFIKTAFEFAFRIPRVRIESVLKEYPPELVNRFFDIVTLQKGLATLLLEFSGAVLQIIFGLLLLSLYNSVFIMLGVVLIFALVLILRFTGPRGLQTSIKESKYKYRIANWLEELARGLSTFKLAGETNLAMERTDGLVTQYLSARKKHFKVLITQYISFVLFKTLITGGLLVAGCILVVNQQINIGQFVASEIVIILIMAAVEKIILKLDTVYDVLTSIDKIAHVTDLPIDKTGHIRMPEHNDKRGISIQVQDLYYRFPDRAKPVLNQLSFKIGTSERVCISGHNGSGKTSLVNIMLGLLNSWQGVVTYDGIPLRDLDRESLLAQVGDYVAQEELFDGSVLENITLGRHQVTLNDVIEAINVAGLTDWLHTLPEGLSTRLVGGNQRVPGSVMRKIILARSICANPRLLLLDDFLLGVERGEKERVLEHLFSLNRKWTVVFISNDPFIMQKCERVLLLSDGRLSAEGSWESLKNNLEMQSLLYIKY
ncbi:MAG: ATP-binding cassette domain-containing protein [Bacteroidia bacterium]|jgi:ABC-type bacteriocin/lantibiotic exporter with double-glycine peptidase domain|nr:ATP-binding cassette domain-containing protein [Bacteroidia bacterium]